MKTLHQRVEEKRARLAARLMIFFSPTCSHFALYYFSSSSWRGGRELRRSGFCSVINLCSRRFIGRRTTTSLNRAAPDVSINIAPRRRRSCWRESGKVALARAFSSAASRAVLFLARPTFPPRQRAREVEAFSRLARARALPVQRAFGGGGCVRRFSVVDSRPR